MATDLVKRESQTLIELLQQPTKYFQSIAVSSPEQAIKSNTPALAAIKKEHGEAVSIAVLVKILESLVRFINVGKTMNDDQVLETCKLIIQEFYYLKLPDLKLCFDRIKTGYYGTIYDRIDGQVIMEIMRKYSEERISVGERLSIENAKTEADKDKDVDGYLVCIGENYLRSDGDDFAEEPRKDIATRYNYPNALKLKEWLVKEYYSDQADKIRITYANKPEIGLLEYIEKNNPDLLKKKEKANRFQYYTDWKKKDEEAKGIVIGSAMLEERLKKEIKAELDDARKKSK